ncbi:MAG: ornithine cyclodeaminase family protein [Chloroflexota bacterium]|nr:ornithine cyclodeaminase family protein [Chloroflexota bacterium]
MTRLTIRFVSAADIEQLDLSRQEIFEAVREVVRAQGNGQVTLEPRMHLRPPDAAGHFNILRAHLGPQGISGVKVVGDFVENYRNELPSELALITLYSPETGAPLAIVDGTMITAARTGAMTALGAQYLARPESAILGHIGARGSAWWNVTMLDDLFDFAEIRVTSRRAASRGEFARRLSEHLGKPVQAVDTPREALEGADVMVEATRLTAPEPLLRTEWVVPGTFVVPYGTVSAVEISLTSAIDKIVVDDWGQATVGPFGALRRHVDEGLLTRETLHAELGEIVAGHRPGREHPDERILFWHRGLATTDAAVAHLVWTRAEAEGIGTVLTFRE